MSPHLENLKITARELERLTGWDVGSIFLGGVLGGVYRPSALRNPRQLATFCLTEVIVFLLLVAFTLPVSLAILTHSGTGISQLSSVIQFLGVSLGLALLVMLGWNAYMWLAGKRLRGLMELLDEIDRYHEVLAAIAVLDQLESVRQDQIRLSDRLEVLEALHLTRDSLIAGLTTERILRQNRGLLARRHALLDSIETNLTALKSLEVKHQAQEYAQILNQALEIGMTVHQEMQKLSQ